MAKKDRRVIPFTRLPSNPMRLVWPAATVYLLLEKFRAPGWLYVTLSILGVIFFGVSIGATLAQEETEVEFGSGEEARRPSWPMEGSR